MASFFCEESFGDFGRLKKCVKGGRRGREDAIATPLRRLRTALRDGCFTITISAPGVSDVWQTKGLKEGDFGSVARKELTGEFSDVWQGKDLGNSDIDSKGFAALLLEAYSEVQIPKELRQSPIGSKGVAGANW